MQETSLHRVSTNLATFLTEYLCTGDVGWSDKVIGDPTVKFFAEVNIQKFCLDTEDLSSLNKFAMARKSTFKTCGLGFLLKPAINDFTKEPLPLIGFVQRILCGQTSKLDKCYGAPVWGVMRGNIMKTVAVSGRSKRQFSTETMIEFLVAVYSSGDRPYDYSIYPEIVHLALAKFTDCLIDKRNEQSANISFQMKTCYLLLSGIVAIVLFVGY